MGNKDCASAKGDAVRGFDEETSLSLRALLDLRAGRAGRVVTTWN
jgi:hypothetical protein